MHTDPPVRWGILGAATIARKNWKAILHSGNGVVGAVASRDARRSEALVEQCQREAPFATCPKAYDSYDAVLQDPAIDAVYIPLPTALRKPWVIRAAEAGKHVVCEKPCAPSAAELREMLDACRRHGVQFMDGVMFMHSRRLGAVRATLDDGATVGDLRRIAFGFSFAGGDEFFGGNIRTHSGLEPHGCLGDLGWYCIRYALWVMGGRVPVRVRGTLLRQSGCPDSPGRVPTEFSAELLFEGGVSAGFYCAFVTAMQQWVHLSGTRGSVRVADFVLPEFGWELAYETSRPHYRVEGCEFNMEGNLLRHGVAEYSNSHPTSQEANLFRNFARQVRSGRLDEGWPEIAWKTQCVMDACHASALSDGAWMVPSST